MNRYMRKAVGLALAGLSSSAGAINLGNPLTSLSDSGNTFVEDEVAIYAWSGQNSTRKTPTVFNASSRNLGWAHNSKWYDIAVTRTGHYRISVQATNPGSQSVFNPAFTLWPVDSDRPFDPQNCTPTVQTAGSCGDASGGQTHSYNQVAAPSPTNSSAWMLGPDGPDVNPDGEPMKHSLKWTPRQGFGHVTGFIGYANSGTGGPGPDAWKAGLPEDRTEGRYGSYQDFSFGNDQDEVLQGGFVNTAPGGGLGGTTLDPRSNVDAPLGQGYAAMNLYGLAAGHYLLALGGSCVRGDCGAGMESYRLEITEITGLPQAFATANSPVRAGAQVTLDGSSSIGADGSKPIDYAWTQSGEPQVTLSPGGNSARQTFTAPLNAAGQTLTFELRVNDGKLESDPATVSVVVTDDNNPPTVTLGQIQSVLEGALVTLAPSVTDGDGGSDGIASYRWEQTQGPVVLLNNPDGKDLSFTAPYVGSGPEPLELAFSLTVTDDFSPNPQSTTLTVPVLVNRDPGRLDCSRAVARPASLWPPNRQMQPVSITGIYSPNSDPYHLTIDSVTQDEPVKDKAAKDRTGPDAKIKRGKATRKKPLKVDQVRLRRERQIRRKNGAGSDNGRVYAVRFTATSPDGETCTGSVKVEVPRARGQGAVDDGQFHDSLRKK